MKYFAAAFKGKSKAATGNQVPPGIKGKSTLVDPAHLSLFSGKEYASEAKHCNKVVVVDVWLMQDDENGTEPKKLRKIHEVCGPTAQKQAEEFIAAWTPNSAVQQPPQCPADGKTLKPIEDPGLQPLLL
jgi:hypothetical protein